MGKMKNQTSEQYLLNNGAEAKWWKYGSPPPGDIVFDSDIETPSLNGLTIESVVGGLSIGGKPLTELPFSQAKKVIQDIADGGDGCFACGTQKKELLGDAIYSFFAKEKMSLLFTWLEDEYKNLGKAVSYASWTAESFTTMYLGDVYYSDQPVKAKKPESLHWQTKNYTWNVEDYDFSIPESPISYKSFGVSYPAPASVAPPESHYARAQSITEMVPDLTRIVVPCPAETLDIPGSTARCGYSSTIFQIVIHLNDHHRWDRATQIADWLETLDADLTVPFPSTTMDGDTQNED